MNLLQCICLLKKGNIFTTNSNISYVYDKFKDEDGYLYLFYNSENTFG